MGIHKECPWCYTKFNPWYHCPKCNHDFSYEYCDGYEAARDRFENTGQQVVQADACQCQQLEDGADACPHWEAWGKCKKRTRTA